MNFTPGKIYWCHKHNIITNPIVNYMFIGNGCNDYLIFQDTKSFFTYAFKKENCSYFKEKKPSIYLHIFKNKSDGTYRSSVITSKKSPPSSYLYESIKTIEVDLD